MEEKKKTSMDISLFEGQSCLFALPYELPCPLKDLKEKKIKYTILSNHNKK